MGKKDANDPAEIRFKSSLHHTKPALTVYGDGDAAVLLSVDASQLPEVAKMLLLLKGATFDVVIPHDTISRKNFGSEGQAPTRDKPFKG